MGRPEPFSLSSLTAFRADYDEVNVMRNAAVQAGLPVDDVFMDHAGFSTYESMYRARDVFGADRPETSEAAARSL